jgi:U3 small nucleolar RNA-associated protein 10
MILTMHYALDSGSDSRNIVALSFQIIEGLFTSIPTFIGTQLDNVFSACLSTELLGLTASKEGPAAKARASLLSAASKKLPAKTIYPAIIRLHASLDESIKEVSGFVLSLMNEVY